MAEQEFWTHENWSGTLVERIPDVLWHRATRFLIVILYAIPLMRRFLLFLACVLFCFGMFASGARAQAVPCCTITAIDAQAGIVSARVNSTSAVFQFKVTDAKTLQSLRVGQGVYANFTTNQVSLDGKKTCCSITNRPQAPVAAPITRPVLPSANGPAASQPSPTLRNQANAVQILKKVASPVNVRTTQSLDECSIYANGNRIGCATAMQGSYYIVIWDWNGSDTDIDGFNIYQGGGAAPSSSRGPVTQLVQQPIQTNSQHPLLRVAVFDPKQVGTNACFTITAYSGGTESARSPQTCVTAANASSPVLSPVPPPLPPGTYLNSCQAMSLRAGTLYASCRNNGGQWVSTSLPNVSQCIGDIVDAWNGSLHCTTGTKELPPGKYIYSCQAIYMNNGTLYASCPAPTPTPPTLPPGPESPRPRPERTRTRARTQTRFKRSLEGVVAAVLTYFLSPFLMQTSAIGALIITPVHSCACPPLVPISKPARISTFDLMKSSLARAAKTIEASGSKQVLIGISVPFFSEETSSTSMEALGVRPGRPLWITIPFRLRPRQIRLILFS